MSCPSTNTAIEDQSSFWNSSGVHWDAHRIGWTVAGATAAATVLISFVHVLLHCRSYYVPRQQRQIVRILLMPAVYAVISWLSYRFYRDYEYYAVAETIYEALAIAAFLYLILEYFGSSTEEQKALLQQKDKQKLPLPLCFLRYRPSKPKFIWVLKWSVLQYCIVRPAVSIAAIICEAYDVLCPQTYSVHYAEVYLDSVDFVSLSVALYGLLAIYWLVKENLAGHKPLAKFLSIKAIVFLTWFQGFVFSLLAKHGALKATEFWTETNIANGIQALAVCCEMVIFSAYNWWAFPVGEYRKMRRSEQGPTNVFWSFLHSQNYLDFLKEIGLIFIFFWDYARGKPETRRQSAFDVNSTFQGKGHLPDQEKPLYYQAHPYEVSSDGQQNSEKLLPDKSDVSPRPQRNQSLRYASRPTERTADDPSVGHAL